MRFLNVATLKQTTVFIDDETTIIDSDSRVVNWFKPVPDGFKRELIGDTYSFVEIPLPSQAELDAQATQMAKQESKAQMAIDKLSGVDFNGVMCSATSEDMWGLSSVKNWIVSGNDVNFSFSNGNKLVLNADNIAAFEAVWIPFRASFF